MIAVSAWQREVGEQLASRLGDRWRVTPVVLDGVRLLRICSRDVADSQRHRQAGERANTIYYDGWVWAGDVPCPPEPLHSRKGVSE